MSILSSYFHPAARRAAFFSFMFLPPVVRAKYPTHFRVWETVFIVHPSTNERIPLERAEKPDRPRHTSLSACNHIRASRQRHAFPTSRRCRLCREVSMKQLHSKSLDLDTTTFFHSGRSASGYETSSFMALVIKALLNLIIMLRSASLNTFRRRLLN